jgi:hypothetical protein
MNPASPSALSSLTRRRFLQASGLALGALAAPAWLRAGAAPGGSAPTSSLPIGMNLSGIADWEPGFPFRNLMLGSRWWQTQDEGGGGPFNTQQIDEIELDPNGYPLEIPARTSGRDKAQTVFTILPSAGLPPGRYVILHDGDGELRTEGNTRTLRSEPGRLLVEMKHEGRDRLEILRIARSARGDHLRNIRVLREADEKADLAKNPFRDEFLQFAAPWHCLRFMDWLQTNNSVNSAWSARKLPSFYTMTGPSGDAVGLTPRPVTPGARRRASGMALEHCIAAANTLRTDAWLCVPHLADDDYIERMALLVRDTLDPRLKVYVEYSNEVWNWQFQQAQWMLRSRRAAELVTAVDPARKVWKTAPSEWVGAGATEAAKNGEGDRHPERIGALFRRCFAIWERVFAGEHRARLVRVCAVQAGWFDTARRTLRWVAENGGCDVLSPAHYFGPNRAVYTGWEAAGAALTAEKVLEDMRSVIEEQDTKIAQFAGLAKEFGVGLAAYEAGQHIQPRNQAETPYNPALAVAQKHPAMKDAYLRHLAQWQRHGGGLWCAFASIGEQGTRWGSWGHLERYGQNPAEMPKFEALISAIAPRRA